MLKNKWFNVIIYNGKIFCCVDPNHKIIIKANIYIYIYIYIYEQFSYVTGHLDLNSTKIQFRGKDYQSQTWGNGKDQVFISYTASLATY